MRQRELSKQTVAILDTQECQDDPSIASCQIIDKEKVVTIDQIRFIYNQSESTTNIKSNFIVISDTNNHCIRLLDTLKLTVRTIAGICGVQGFRDGPLNENKLNKPGSLGMDVKGNIWVYDSGNKYIRQLKLNFDNDDIFNGVLLVTMIKGACRNLPENLKPGNYQNKFNYAVCYSSWVKTSGQPDQHIFDQTYLDNFCVDHFENCPQFKGTHSFFEGINRIQ